MQTPSLLLALTTLGACSHSGVAPSSPTTAAVIDGLRGQWDSVDSSSTGGCTKLTVLVVPSGGTARVEFGATCGSAAIATSGSATVSGTTLGWAAEYVGSLTIVAGETRCSVGGPVSGALQRIDAGSARLTYSARGCNADVSGSAILSLRP